jgi:hypothetical protein
MKGENLGFASVFNKILAQGPSIYRDFGSMISCTCMTPSPSLLIRLGFGFDWILLRFLVGEENFLLSFIICHGEGDDLAWAAPGPRAREAREG